MERKYTLLINNEQMGTVCWKGEGTAEQVKRDIRELTEEKGIKVSDLDVIPVIGSRGINWKLWAAVSGISLIMGLMIYENLRKRMGKGREHSDS